MPWGIHNPLPTSLRSECKQAAKILASFVDPRQAFGPDKVIPPEILQNAKGLAILTVLKAGFLGSGRFGSGLVIARLADGTWSAPSALMTGGGGFGGQIGFELTNFVFILNDYSAVKTFSQQGSLTLGGNVSIAAGPVGRNAEAAGVASLKSVSGIFSYSKTKGLFAGVSLEGSAIIERRDANEKMYNTRITARQLLEGGMRPPEDAEPLMRVLRSQAFSGVSSLRDTSIYNDIPVYDDSETYDPTYGRGEGGSVHNNDPYEYRDRPTRSSTWAGGPDSPHSPSRANPYETFDSMSPKGGRRGTIGSTNGGNKPARPTAPKPAFKPRTTAAELGKDQAVALYTFDAAQPGDLGFKKGEIINIVKRTENKTDWWTGRIGDREGVFPSNYVDAK